MNEGICKVCGEPKNRRNSKFCSKECSIRYKALEAGNDPDEAVEVHEQRTKYPCMYADDDVPSDIRHNRRCTRIELDIDRMTYMPIYSIEHVCGDCRYRKTR